MFPQWLGPTLSGVRSLRRGAAASPPPQPAQHEQLAVLSRHNATRNTNTDELRGTVIHRPGADCCRSGRYILVQFAFTTDVQKEAVARIHTKTHLIEIIHIAGINHFITQAVRRSAMQRQSRAIGQRRFNDVVASCPHLVKRVHQPAGQFTVRIRPVTQIADAGHVSPHCASA